MIFRYEARSSRRSRAPEVSEPSAESDLATDWIVGSEAFAKVGC